MKSPVIIVPYNPQWPEWFRAEARLVRGVLGRRLSGLQHFGSTSVPGLAAKPIVDILAGVRSRDAAEEMLPGLDAIGYHDVTPQPGHPDWFYCLGKRTSDGRQFHLHLARPASRFWRGQLRFRDALRRQPGLVRGYAALKRRLARRYRQERGTYSLAKGGFIRWGVAKSAGCSFRLMSRASISGIARAFAGWNKTRQQYERYFDEQQHGTRAVIVARQRGKIIGYGTICWRSPEHVPFQCEGIPEIVDLNVLRPYQGRGVGSALIHVAERMIARRGRRTAGISACVASPDVLELYKYLGYVPDGRGVTEPDNELHLVKELVI